MLSSVAIFGGSKGMVAMPDLSGLSRDAAIATVQSAGLVFSSSSNVDSTSGNNGKVVSQSIASGTLIDYESAITFVVGLYTAPSGPVITYVTDTNPDGSLKIYEVNDGSPFCVTTNSPYLESQKRKYVYLTYRYIDGVKDPNFTALETPTNNPVAPTITTAYSTNCGYVVPPAVTCTTATEEVSSWSSCSNGYREKYIRDKTVCTDGTSSTSNLRLITESCCVTVSSQTSCTSCICNSRSCTTERTILCGSTTRTETTTNPDVSCTSSSQTNCA
jgi:hypothetical protein